MRFLLTTFAFLLLVSVSMGAADKEKAKPTTVELTEEKVANDLPYLANVWNLLGVVQYEKAPRVISVHSGFFIKSNQFATIGHPRSTDTDPTIKCDGGQTYVTTGTFNAQGEMPKHFKCTKVLVQDPQMGVTVLEVVPNEAGISLPKEGLKLSESNPLSKKSQSFVALGHSLDGKIHYSAKCRVDDLDAQPNFKQIGIEVPRGVWSYATCPTVEGMIGGPVLARVNREWIAAGILITLGKDRDHLAFSKLSSILKKHHASLQ